MPITYTSSVQDEVIRLARHQIEIETAAIFEEAMKQATAKAIAKQKEIIANTMIAVYRHTAPQSKDMTLTIEITDKRAN